MIRMIQALTVAVVLAGVLSLLVFVNCGCGGKGCRDPIVGPYNPAHGDPELMDPYCGRHRDWDPKWVEVNCGICHWIV